VTSNQIKHRHACLTISLGYSELKIFSLRFLDVSEPQGRPLTYCRWPNPSSKQ
jgi:hypothetical protein